MTAEKSDDYQIKTGHAETQLDTSVAFIQIPTKIKDQVTAFIDGIIDEADALKISTGREASPFQSSGCFFVISLEKIEAIHGMLKQALNPGETDLDQIRAHVKQALTALQGQ